MTQSYSPRVSAQGFDATDAIDRYSYDWQRPQTGAAAPGNVRFAPHPAHGGPAYVAPALAVDEVPVATRLGPTQWAGAALSLALIVGLGVWGTKMMLRDISGVPVIRALPGEARLVPEDPGGQLAMHQGLAVNSVTADGSAAPPADRLVLAPATTALTDEDEAFGTLNASAFAEVAPDAPLALDAVEPVAAVGDEVAETLGVVGVERSPRPTLRPLRLASADPSASLSDVAGDIAAALAAEGEMTPEDVPAGARLVQLGAFPEASLARAEWDRLTGRFGELLEGKTRVIYEAASGGQAFYRLRAYGFEDKADAERFCAALSSMNAGCVPTQAN